MLEMFLSVLEEELQIEINPQRAPIARMSRIMNKLESLTRAGEQRNAPTEAGGGWTCIKCKTANNDDKSICGFCDTPRLGG